MNMLSDYLFVYGTLMQGFNNPFAKKLHESAYFEDYGNFAGVLYAVSWYPGALYDPDSSGKVYGEVYRMKNATELISVLDEYEDVLPDETESLYIRRTIPVYTNQGQIHCQTYLYNQPVTTLQLIASGDFRNL
jgi:gamma-glutamylcyclotransferase (GGCT)/AIG2-like uncharacterized protein YtfP